MGKPHFTNRTSLHSSNSVRCPSVIFYFSQLSHSCVVISQRHSLINPLIAVQNIGTIHNLYTAIPMSILYSYRTFTDVFDLSLWTNYSRQLCGPLCSCIVLNVHGLITQTHKQVVALNFCNDYTCYL